MISLFRTVRSLLQVLPAGSRRFIQVFAAILGALALFDIAALGILAILLTPMLTGSEVRIPVVGIELSDPAHFGLALGVVCGLIIMKDILGIVVQRMSTRRFAKFEQSLGAQLLDSFFLAPWSDRLSRNSTDLVRSTDVGVASTVSGVLIPYTQLMGEVATFVAVMTVLVVATPWMALAATVYFAIVGVALYRWVFRRAVTSGQDNRKYSTRSVRLVAEMVNSLKEITLRNKAQEVEDVVLSIRQRASAARADQAFLGSVPRYILEIALIVGLALAAFGGYTQGGLEGALSQLALFAIAGFRLVPALTRFQTIMGQTAANIPYAERVLKEIEAGRRHRANYVRVSQGTKLAPDAAHLELENVSFAYPSASTNAVNNVSLEIPFGSSLALVGASGSGKSTLVDLILGLLEPSEGQISIDSIPIKDALKSWQERVGYVPQQVALFDSTVAHNVALTWRDEEIDEERVRRALRRAQLLDVIEARPGGIWGKVGEGGLTLSSTLR